ncbi:hypothetical protein ACFLQR_00915 [Verrucomicrobiota bacterium]
MDTRAGQIARETQYLRAFQREADRISHLILMTDFPWIDILIEIENLRNEAERLFPRKMELFEMIYVNRFERQRREWRTSDSSPDNADF